MFWGADPSEPGPILVQAARIDGVGPVMLDPNGAGNELLLTEPIQTTDSAIGRIRIFSGGVSFQVAACYVVHVDAAGSITSLVFRVVASRGAAVPGGVDWTSLERPLLIPDQPVHGACSTSPARSIIPGVGTAGHADAT
jgi:hypothetical protein